MERSITLHSTWRSLVGGGIGAVALAGAGTVGVAVGGFTVFATGLFVLGWVLVLVLAFDFPVASTFTHDRVVRRMMLRTQSFPWRDGDRLTRTRPAFVKVDRRIEHGGLVLRRGRRRYLLVDRVESADEFDAVVELLEQPGARGEHLGTSMLPRPGAEVPPTWLYRRKRWRPDSATTR